jgi:hypothetical protein
MLDGRKLAGNERQCRFGVERAGEQRSLPRLRQILAGLNPPGAAAAAAAPKLRTGERRGRCMASLKVRPGDGLNSSCFAG